MSSNAKQYLQAELVSAISRYASRNAKSEALHHEAIKNMPGGNTRTVLHASPFPVVIKSGKGHQVTSEDGHKWVGLLLIRSSI